MPSSLADALAERLLERLPPRRAYDRPALAEATREGEPPLPRTVRHFLERMMTRRVEIEQERLGVLRQPWLDYEHEDVRRAEEALVEAVRRHVHIPAEAWERVLRHACERVAAHLVRPAPTLEDFVFGENETPGPGEATEGDSPDLLPARVVQRRLSYFAAYPYLREAVNAYVEQRDVASFQRERLGALLRRVDERMCAGHDTESWLRLLQPLFALGRAAYPNHDGLPAELLEAFFEEKKADFPLRRLRRTREKHDLAALSPSALGEVLATSEAPARAPQAEADAEAPDAPTTEEPTDDASPGEAAAATSEPEEPDAPDDAAGEPSAQESSATPLWKRFAGLSSGGQPEEEARSEGPSADRNGDRAAARPRWQQFSAASPDDAVLEEDPPEKDPPAEGEERAAPASPPPEPAPAEEPPSTPEEASASPASRALRQVEEEVLGPTVSDSERARFVRELFDGSEEAYERVLRRLREAEDWQEATQIIARDVFRAHGINIYSDPARDFTNAVEARFR